MERHVLFINGTNAWDAWGVSLDFDGGVDALLCYPPNKEPVTNKNVTAVGAYVVCGTGLKDERTVSVPLNIVARSYDDFLTKKDAFYNAIYGSSALSVVVKMVWRKRVKVVVEIDDVEREVWQVKETSEEIFSSSMYYVGCNQYTQFVVAKEKRYNKANDSWSDVVGSGYGSAKFVLTLYEPNGG